ncbi:PBSX family phage terminase large subunit [Bacillus sp. COPE52]|uniref:PBSX family phage terminase large subunit n=1 Tax=Bacillus sp. COPE52 TaxID=2233998 RepID=UPI000E10A8DA|nr:PBSX family phage terminase large subunit [Bacillus sp. COPE52]AXK19134.1 PBSX family phage terminase large subunit [Bacillus sp. COPE52]
MTSVDKTVNMRNVISPRFRKVWYLSRMRKCLRYVLKGGRASGKSFFIPFRILTDIMEYPISWLILRKVQNTIVRSVFEQVLEAMEVMGIRHLFRPVPSRLVIEYIPRGNKIYFLGCEDPERIKSIKDSKYPIMGMWIEECGEFRTEEEVSIIEKSILRGDFTIAPEQREDLPNYEYTFFFSYNPPKRRGHWLNKKYNSAFIATNTHVNHSTYKDNKHLTKAFYEEAAIEKEMNPLKYRWEYEGEAIGSGIVPFDNLIIEQIPQEQIDAFDNIRQAVDFGFATDPMAFVRCHYDKKRRTLYIFDEYYGVKISNRQLAAWIKAKGYDAQEITADSAEPKSISELKNEHGIRRIAGAKKGPDSVEYGTEWLGELYAIVIDPKRCPNAAKEFENIDFETDKDGNPRPRLQDKDNHSIDAVRYAMEKDMKKGNKLRTAKRSQLGF